MVDANLLACRAAEPAWGLAINVACGDRISVKSLATRLGRACGAADISPRHDPARAGDVRHSQADISRAVDLLHFAPQVDLDEGLRRTVEWYRNA